MKFVIILAALIAFSYGQTLHPSHEPSVHESFTFFYDYHTHKMMIINHQNCYIFTLTDQQKVDVHTDPGLTALELQLIPLVDSGTKTEVQKSSLEAGVVSACGHSIKHYYTMS
ncbi:hypothetical protein ACJMK2_014934 [Sinanodonta woodiana]|uniref:Uncharacterized protein n=1 Tax=Sinanodonta woodiana TaxID=1069815 RepID=A0ABD3V257_SINWO